MKRSIQSTLLTLTALLMTCAVSTKAQTMTGTVLTQPCNNNGSIGVTVTGLTPPISYSYTNWVTGQNLVNANVNSTTNSISGLGAYQAQWTNPNVWNVTASDGVASASITLAFTPAFSDSIQILPGFCPALSTVQAIGITGGTPPFSCVWTNITTNQVYTTNPAAVANGPYALVITDGAGCMVSTITGTYAIYVMSQSNISVNITGAPANCINGTASVTASGGTAPYTYLWSNNAVTQNLSGLVQGIYNCIVTDAAGCQNGAYYFEQQATTINYNNTITNATCLQNNGGVTSFVNGGTAPYSYAWSNGATTANLSGLSSGSYNVQITDANGCIGTGFAYVNATTPISVTYAASPSSCTLATGSATLTPAGGAAPYSIIWYSYPTNTTGTSINSKPSGSYNFKVTDANGCIQTGSAYIPPVSTINAYISSNSVICPATTGTLTAYVSGSNPPFTYLWNNASTTSALNSVPLGAYTCTITDAVGCSVRKYGPLYQTSPINVGLSVTAATCLYASNGALTANATGGTAPYTYNWSNTQTGPSATGLSPGYYAVTVTDANGCSQYGYTYVNNNASSNACYCVITGSVFADANSNCVQNAGEAGVPNIQIHCSGMGYAFTDANGVYSFMVPSGTYTLTESIQQIYPLASCQSNNQVVSVTAAANCSTTVNFANNVVVISDLHIITADLNWPVPGGTYNQKVIVQNEGSATENIVQLGYTHDGQLTYNNCTPWALTQQNAGTYPDWYSITSGFPSLSPGTNSSSYINYNVPSNIPLNTVVNFYDTVARTTPIAASWLTDNTPWNNVDNHWTTVIGSYDPNFKEVTPKGLGPQGNITTNDSVLTYVVHFQNTGSYYAQNIVVIDTLDSDLRMSSLRPGYSDHNYVATVSESGVAKFTFPNINLAWQANYGDVLSSGMFVYSIKLKKNLPLGTQIKNRAAIYFDYNQPVMTNNTINTIATNGPVGIKELKGVGSDGVALYPNPAKNYFTLSLASAQNASGVLSIFDISGREISIKAVDLQAGENNLTEETGHLQNGIYFVQLKTANILVGKKLVIAK